MMIRALALTIVILFAPAAFAINIPAGEPAPGFSLMTMDGDTVSLDNRNEKVTVIIYWRPDHKRSRLALKDAQAVMNNLNGSDISLIAVVAGTEDIGHVKEAVRENDIAFPVAVDAERQFFSDYGIRVYPTTVIIDGEGIISHSIPSHPLTYRKLFEGYVKKALGEIDESRLNEMLSPHNEEVDKSHQEALRLYSLAMKFMENGMIDLASNSVRKAIEVRPDLLKSHILLGFLYLEMKEPEKALETFNKALELDADSNDAKTGLGGALIMTGDLDRAIEVLKEASVANPYAQMTYYELGKAYEKKGDKDKSIKMYKKAIEKIIHKQILPSSISKCK